MKRFCKLAALAVMALGCLHPALADVEVFDAIESADENVKKRDKADKRGKEEDHWRRYSSLSLSFPSVNRDFEPDEGERADCEFTSYGVGFDYQAHHVAPSGFTVLTRCGFAYLEGDLDVDYGRWWDERDRQWYSDSETLEDISGFFTYFRLGFGYALQLFGRHLAIIPTAGAGFGMSILYAEYDTIEEYYPSYGGGSYPEYYEYADDFYDVGITVDLFGNLMVALMLTDHFGLSASCEVSFNAVGGGSATDLDSYTTKFGRLSCIPTVGVCLRF